MSEMEWVEIFGDNLVDILNEAWMTQRELADDSGLSEGTVSKYIHKQQLPTIRAVVNMSQALNINLDDFIDFGDMIG